MTAVETNFDLSRIDFDKTSEVMKTSYWWGAVRNDELNHRAFESLVCLGAYLNGKKVGLSGSLPTMPASPMSVTLSSGLNIAALASAKNWCSHCLTVRILQARQAEACIPATPIPSTTIQLRGFQGRHIPYAWRGSHAAHESPVRVAHNFVRDNPRWLARMFLLTFFPIFSITWPSSAHFTCSLHWPVHCV